MSNQPFTELIEIMEQLRGKDGCPWDKKQTHQSLRQFLLEETFEVLESIDQNNLTALKEELGDLLLQIVFHAQIASETDQFDINDVIDSINHKLIFRHPNVFGDTVIIIEKTNIKEEIYDIKAYWYEIEWKNKTGYIWGGLVSTMQEVADFNLDGKKEILLYSITILK